MSHEFISLFSGRTFIPYYTGQVISNIVVTRSYDNLMHSVLIMGLLSLGRWAFIYYIYYVDSIKLISAVQVQFVAGLEAARSLGPRLKLTIISELSCFVLYFARKLVFSTLPKLVIFIH